MAKRDSTPSTSRKPILIIPGGRGRTGKTAFGNTLAQFYRSQGATLRIWDMDNQTTTHSLAAFHPDAETPPSGGLTDQAAWLESKIHEQAVALRSGTPFDALLGIGGGDLLIRKLAQEVRLVRLLERMGIRPVMPHMIGPDAADLDYLTQMAEDDLFTPEATLLVLNAGLVADGRSAAAAFAAVASHPAVLGAIQRGAKVAHFPALAPMRRIAESGQSFAEAAEGAKPAQGEALSFFDQERTAIWWEEAIPEFFGDINPLWMPAASQPAEAVPA